MRVSTQRVHTYITCTESAAQASRTSLTHLLHLLFFLLLFLLLPLRLPLGTLPGGQQRLVRPHHPLLVGAGRLLVLPRDGGRDGDGWRRRQEQRQIEKNPLHTYIYTYTHTSDNDHATGGFHALHNFATAALRQEETGRRSDTIMYEVCSNEEKNTLHTTDHDHVAWCGTAQLATAALCGEENGWRPRETDRNNNKK